MPIKILMPALSPTMTEGNLAKWHKKEGDPVQAGDVIAEIETDKATMEVESVDDGILGKIVVGEGSEGVKVNEVIGLILAEDEDQSALEGALEGVAALPTQQEIEIEPQAEPEPQPQPQPVPAPAAPSSPASGPELEAAEAAATPLARRMASQAGLELAAIPGTGARGKIIKADIDVALGGGRTRPEVASAPVPGGNGNGAAAARIVASPLARRLAEERGLDLGAISGTGPGGRIVKSDVEATAASGGTPAPAHLPPGEGYTTVPLSQMRKIIATRLTESKQTIPHYYLSLDCEIDELLKVRAELNARDEEIKLSVNDLVIRAVALALREVPAANASWDDGALRQYHAVDISVAVAVDGGLITPIVRHADRKGLAEISAEMKDLAARARDGKLMPEEYQGGSTTISNLGMYGVKEFAAVINPPQASILAIGAGEKRPVVKDDELAITTVMTATLSCDHRVIDGALGAEFLAAIKRRIEYPPAMLL